MGLAAIGAAAWGAWEVVTTGSQVILWSAVALVAVCALMLSRMARVSARAVAREVRADEVERPPLTVQDLALGDTRTVRWTPRELPRPLASSAGSRAAAVLDEAAAREALRLAEREERLRAREAQLQPPSIDAARRAREAAEAERFGRMGYIDDAEIEAHVRQLLERRASGS